MYYYRAVRVGSRVVKEYVPPHAVELAIAADERARAERAASAEATRAAKAEIDALAEALNPLDALADTLVRAAMLAAGYKRHHRGPWRKSRATAAPAINPGQAG